MTFRQELTRRKKEQAFKEFEYQATSKNINLPSHKELADRFGVSTSAISKWRTEWIKKRKEVIKIGL